MTAATDDDGALACPLCGYDLRGLPEHRCPECGHAFDLDELRRAKDGRREQLFEDAPRRQLAIAFVRTTLRSLRPIRFWQRVRPERRVEPTRLALWAAWWMLVGVFGVVACGIVGVILSIESTTISSAKGGGYLVLPRYRGWGRTYPSPPSLLDAVVFWFDHHHLTSPLALLVGISLWAPITVAVLHLFNSTLRHANIRGRHIWRCTLYAVPSIAIPALAFAAFSCFEDVNATSHWEWSRRTTDAMMWWPKPSRQILEVIELSPAAAAILAWSALASTAHLLIAHVRYLRLPHAVAQALLVQTASWLLIVTVIVFRTGRL